MKKYAIFAPAKTKPKPQPKPCGTIVPTADDLATNDAWHATNEQRRKAAAHAAGLKNPVIVGGEARYYDGEFYAIISSKNFRVLWFRVTPNGDFACKR